MMGLKYWMMKERILNRNYSSASNWNPSFLVDDLKKLGMLFNEIFFENLPIRTERGNKGRPDSRTNPGGLWFIVYSLYFVQVCHLVVRLLSFRQHNFLKLLIAN